MDADEGGRWTETPILPELPPPPADRILVRGARLIRVYNVEALDPRQREGHTEAVILAWARLGDGGWGVLTAWASSWRQANGRTTGRARWTWCRLLQDRARPVNPPPPRVLIEGAEWHGWHAESEFAKAVRAAAAMLPEHLRRAALTPTGQPPSPAADNLPT